MEAKSVTELKTFQTEFIDKKQNIIIPLLQRDYVQGGRFDVIEPFLGQLISALKDDDDVVNLNYIYGYNKGDNGFVPIDGQQRLITLWLLHLYLNPHDFEVRLLFESREFADNFCKQLGFKLYGILEEQKQTKRPLKELITDSEWFVSGWLLDTTVRNMLNTLQLIDDNKERIPDNPHLENITFDFLNLEDKGLDEDVYVKMNGRGRPLSYFENLKSWMDEQVKSIFGEDNAFTKDWRIKMDNDWTELFWKNRNTRQDYPEEIDDEQIRFFYSMLLLYWKMKEDDFLANSKIAKESSAKSHFISFLNKWEKEEKNKLATDTADIKNIRKKTFAFLRNGEKMLPLYWINETNLFNKDIFQFINDGLDVLKALEKHISNIPKKTDNYVNTIDGKITCILDFNEDQSILYHVALNKDDTTYSKTLPLLHALIKTPESYRNENVFKWVRLWRNLVLNSDIDADNIRNACKTIDFVSNKINDNNLYQVITELQWEKGFAFSEDQFNEEIAKAKQIVKEGCEWESRIIEAEKYAFFKGAIRFLFTDDKGNVDWNKFDTKWQNAQKYFESDGVRKEYKDQCVLLRTLISNFKMMDDFTAPYYMNSKENWRDKILLNKNLAAQVDCLLSSNDMCDFEKFDSEIEDAKIHKMQNQLVKTNILINLDEDWYYLEKDNVRLHIWHKNHSNDIYLGDNVHDNETFASLIDKNYIVCGRRIKNTTFFRGENIEFQYNQYFFTYYSNNTVCLMNENWIGKKLKNQENQDTQENNFYFLPVDEKETEQSFLHKLDCLIAQAFLDVDKSVCEKCQDKICESTSKQ